MAHILVGEHAQVCMYLSMNAGTYAHTAQLKAYWISCLHIRIPTYLNHSLFPDKFGLFLPHFSLKCLLLVLVINLVHFASYGGFHYKFSLFALAWF